MAWLNRLIASRKLRNGSGDVIKIATPTDDDGSVDWWLDTCKLIQGLSKGDRSAFSGALKGFEAGEDVALATAAGSVTQELYLRLGHLGYFGSSEKGPTPQPQLHHLNETAIWRAPLCILATQSVMNDAKGNLRSLRAFCDGFIALDRAHLQMDYQTLQEISDMFLSHKGEITASTGSNQEKLWQVYEKNGALDPLPNGGWKVSTMGMTVAPFLLHRVLHRKNGTSA